MASFETFDAHNDLLNELVVRSREPNPFGRYYLEELRAGGVRLQVCPIYLFWDQVGERSLRSTMENVQAWRRAAADNPGEVVLVRSHEDLELARETDRIGLLLSFEGVEPIGNDPSLIEPFVELGVRMVGLTHFQRNLYADGNGEPPQGGLSTLGRLLVTRLQELGVIIDLAHASDGTFADVLEVATEAPVVVSHTACRSLHEIPRNITDDQMRAVAARDGVVGLFPMPMFLGADLDCSLDRFVEHIQHAVEVVGIEHVGLGGDFISRLLVCPGLGVERIPPWLGVNFDQMALVVDGIDGPRGYPTLAAELERRGLAEGEVAAIMGGNFMRVLERALRERKANHLTTEMHS
ncbi:MAG: dipeptidase [Actinobacteria bacterium]|nr:dipeptidase [Actinomycetota bacterium]